MQYCTVFCHYYTPHRTPRHRTPHTLTRNTALLPFAVLRTPRTALPYRAVNMLGNHAPAALVRRGACLPHTVGAYVPLLPTATCLILNAFSSLSNSATGQQRVVRTVLPPRRVPHVTRDVVTVYRTLPHYRVAFTAFITCTPTHVLYLHHRRYTRGGVYGTSAVLHAGLRAHAALHATRTTSRTPLPAAHAWAARGWHFCTPTLRHLPATTSAPTLPHYHPHFAAPLLAPYLRFMGRIKGFPHAHATKGTRICVCFHTHRAFLRTA